MRANMTILNKYKAWLFIPRYLINSYLSVLKSHSLMPSPEAVVKKRLQASSCWVLKDDPCKTINRFQVTILMTLIIYRIIECLEMEEIHRNHRVQLSALCTIYAIWLIELSRCILSSDKNWCWNHFPEESGPVTNHPLSGEFSPSKK